MLIMHEKSHYTQFQGQRTNLHFLEKSTSQPLRVHCMNISSLNPSFSRQPTKSTCRRSFFNDKNYPKPNSSSTGFNFFLGKFSCPPEEFYVGKIVRHTAKSVYPTFQLTNCFTCEQGRVLKPISDFCVAHHKSDAKKRSKMVLGQQESISKSDSLLTADLNIFQNCYLRKNFDCSTQKQKKLFFCIISRVYLRSIIHSEWNPKKMGNGINQ